MTETRAELTTHAPSGDQNSSDSHGKSELAQASASENSRKDSSARSIFADGRGKELTKRIVTGVIGGIALILALVYGGRLGAGIIAAGLALMMLFEYSEVVFTLSDRKEKRWVILGTAWLVAFTHFWIPRAEFFLVLACFMGLFTYFLFTADRFKDEEFQVHFKELAYSFFGMIYLGFLPLFLVQIRDAIDGLHWTLVFFITVWLADTGAYFVGLRFGKRKLYPAISPKKTMEGAAGGLAVALVGVLLYKFIWFQGMAWAAALFIPILVGVASQIGDLCESFFKRVFDMKDSGNLLPGHGGFLDRFDGIIFSLPIMYICVSFLG